MNIIITMRPQQIHGNICSQFFYKKKKKKKKRRRCKYTKRERYLLCISRVIYIVICTGIQSCYHLIQKIKNGSSLSAVSLSAKTMYSTHTHTHVMKYMVAIVTKHDFTEPKLPNLVDQSQCQDRSESRTHPPLT